MTEPPPPNTIYQFSVLSALMAGISSAGSSIPASRLTAYSQGIGTFAGMDGELVLLDHEVYQLRADGTVRLAGPDEPIPFATVTRLEPTVRFPVPAGGFASKEALHEALAARLPGTANVFVAYRIRGAHFARLTLRAIHAQRHPHQSLADLGRDQAVFSRRGLDGDLVGFRSPRNWQGIGVAGDHMHFLSHDRAVGGHVLDMVVQGPGEPFASPVAAEAAETEAGAGSGPPRPVEVECAVVKDIHIELPLSSEFNDAALGVDDEGIRRVEG